MNCVVEREYTSIVGHREARRDTALPLTNEHGPHPRGGRGMRHLERAKRRLLPLGDAMLRLS
eukprot:48943-Prymnesium_polylepis.2